MTLSVNGRAIGRPKGTGRKLGPRTGSRASLLLSLQPGQRTILEAPKGRLGPFMAQIHTDANRSGLNGRISVALLLGLNPTTREVIDLVVITRKEDREQEN